MSNTAAQARPRTLPDPKQEPTIDVDRAAAILGVSRDAVYAAVREDTLVHIRVGRRVVIPTARFLQQYGLLQAA